MAIPAEKSASGPSGYTPDAVLDISGMVADVCDSKMKDLDRLLSVIIHQVRNHSMTVKGYTSLLRYEDGISEKGHKWIANINKGISNLESFLHAFEKYRLARNQRNERINIDLIVKEIWGSLSEISGLCAGLRMNIQDGTIVKGDPGDFSKMMYHLLKNAYEAIDEDGFITVDLQSGDRDGSPGCEWCLEIKDNGRGMTEEELSRANEILFTTKKAHIGCGLNLVSAVASRMDAVVEISSRSGEGSVVRIKKFRD